MVQIITFAVRHIYLRMDVKDTFFSKKPSLNIRGRLIPCDPALVMGILNITPDSFYAGSRITEPQDILERASDMVRQGADILDVGGYSSRPGAGEITEKEELRRLAGSLPLIREAFPGIPLSVDTFRASVARKAVEDFGADMINDISGGRFDPEMIPAAADLQVPYVLMHIKGRPADMQEHAVYDDVVREIIHDLSGRIEELNRVGVNDIIIDPGFGFAKTVSHNFQILKELEAFAIFAQPLLVGLSRKSMIYKSLSTDPGQALNGSTVLHTIALIKGARILRVHDVREAREAVMLVKKTLEAGP